MPLTIGGTTNATIKLFIQFDEAPIETPFARIERGNISDHRCQPITGLYYLEWHSRDYDWNLPALNTTVQKVQHHLFRSALFDAVDPPGEGHLVVPMAVPYCHWILKHQDNLPSRRYFLHSIMAIRSKAKACELRIIFAKNISRMVPEPVDQVNQNAKPRLQMKLDSSFGALRK